MHPDHDANAARKTSPAQLNLRSPRCTVGCPTLPRFRVSRITYFDGRKIFLIDGLPKSTSRDSVETMGSGTGKCERPLAPTPQVCRRARSASRPSLAVAARAASLDAICARRRQHSRGRGEGKPAARSNKRNGLESGQVSCQDFAIKICEGRHRFFCDKNREQLRILPFDTVRSLNA